MAHIPRSAFRTLAAAAAACVWLGACAGQDPAGDDGPLALQAFLEGAAPVPEHEADLRTLGEIFAEQAVRADGYRRSGVDDAEGDGWSPVVRSQEGDAEPADVSPWVDAGDIDGSGRFAPRGDLCLGEGPFTTEGLPDEARNIVGVQDRIASLSCALSRLTGGDVEITWTGPSTVALTLDGGGAVRANARILHLIVPTAPPTAGSRLEVASADPEHGARLSPEAAPPSGPTPALAAETRDLPAVDNHPRPKPDSSGSSSKSWCDKACDDVWNDTFDCGSDSSDSSSSSGCGKSSDSDNSSCDKCSAGGRSGGAGPLSFSLVFLAVLLLRRRTRRLGRGVSGLRARGPLGRRMPGLRVRGSLGGAVVLAAALLASSRGFAQDPEWKRHEKAGTEHLLAKRYGEAITELQAAQALHPAPEHLEKIASAQKALNKSAAAIATLEGLLEQFGNTMSPAQRKRVKDEIARLRAALVPIRVQVEPPTARVSIDGDALAEGSAAAPVLVAPGKHVVSAAIDGYTPASKEVDVPAGAKDLVVALRLVPDKTYVVVRAPAADHLIEIDGVPVGAGTWAGLLTPGRHIVFIHPRGATGPSYLVQGAAGQSVDVPSPITPLAPAGPPGVLSPPPTVLTPLPPPPPPPPKLALTGPYFLGSATLLWQTSRPYGFEHRGTPAPGFSLGGRLGYRPTSTVGFEFLLEYGRISNGGDVIQEEDVDRNGDGAITGTEAYTDISEATYLLQSVRIGPTLRLMTSGQVNRFVGGIGLGALYEFIQLDHVDVEWNSATQQYEHAGTFEHEWTGWTPYFLLEGGYERSVGNLLLGGSLQATMEVVSGIDGEPYDTSVQARFGISLRVGYAAWSSRGAATASRGSSAAIPTVERAAGHAGGAPGPVPPL